MPCGFVGIALDMLLFGGTWLVVINKGTVGADIDAELVIGSPIGQKHKLIPKKRPVAKLLLCHGAF